MKVIQRHIKQSSCILYQTWKSLSWTQSRTWA